MYKYLLSFSLCVLLLGNTFAQSNLVRIIDRLVLAEVDFEKNPGLVIGVISKDSSHVLGYGTVNKNKNQKPDGNTIFEIGAITKVFTASLLSLSEQNKVLSFEDPASKYIGETEKNLSFGNQAISLEDLANHSSGLPRLPFNFGQNEKDGNNPYANYSKLDLIRFLKSYSLTALPGENYLYSHLGYELLTRILENAHQKSYSDLLETMLLKPLELNDTHIKLSKEQSSRLATGYNVAGDQVNYWDYKTFEGSIGLKSTGNDLIRFLRSQMEPSAKQYQAFSRLHEEELETDIKRIKMATGWHLIKTHKKFPAMVAHSGTTGGFRAYVAFIPKTQTGVVVLSNSENNINGIGLMVMEIINYNWNLKKAMK